jgi:hypothetical protein
MRVSDQDAAFERLKAGIERFVARNRALCKILVQHRPRYFANPSYEHELRLRVGEDLAHSIGDVLEIGGTDRPFSLGFPTTSCARPCYARINVSWRKKRLRATVASPVGGSMRSSPRSCAENLQKNPDQRL